MGTRRTLPTSVSISTQSRYSIIIFPTAPECLLAISRYLHQMQRQNSRCCCNAFHGVNNSLHQLQHQSSVLTSLSWSRPLHEAAASSDPIMIAAVVQMTAVEVDSGQDVCCSIQSITTLTSPGAGVKHADMLVPGSNVSNGHIVMQGTLHQH